MRKPYARTPSSKEIDRRVCFETTSKKGVLCASPYGQSPLSSIQAPSSHTPPFYQPKQAPMLRLTAMLALPAPPLSLLPPPFSSLSSSLLRSPFPSFWPRTLLTKQPHASTRLYECVDGIRCAFGQHYPSSRCVRPTPVCMRTLLKSASQTCVEICKSNMPCCSSVAGVRGRWRFPPGLPAVSGCTL